MNTLFKKIVAAAVIMAAFAMPVAVPATAGAAASCDASNLTLSSGTQCAKPQGTPTELIGEGGIFTTVANILIFLVGVIAVIMLIIGGIRYAVSNGDSTAVTNAKNTILYAIVGLVVAFMAFAIINFITSRLTENSSIIQVTSLL